MSYQETTCTSYRSSADLGNHGLCCIEQRTIGHADNIGRNDLILCCIRRTAEEAAFIAALMPSFVTSLPLTTAVRMVVEPVGTGTRCAEPISLPFSSGITRPIALAAPVELGTMLTAACTSSAEVAFSVRSVQNHLVTGVSMNGSS